MNIYTYSDFSIINFNLGILSPNLANNNLVKVSFTIIFLSPYYKTKKKKITKCVLIVMTNDIYVIHIYVSIWIVEKQSY